MSAVRAALRRPGFARLLAALAVSGIGDWLYNVALLALVWDRTGSAGWLAATTVARVAPIVVLGPLGGVLAQRYDRRLVMVTSDLLRAAAMLSLAAVALAGLPVWLAPLIAGLATAAGAPYPPCVAATTPRLVGDDDLAGANTARALVTPAGVVLGPVLGALVLAVSTPGLAIAANALTFLLSAVAVLSVRVPGAFAPTPCVTGARDSVLAELAAGGRALLRHRVARRAVGADTGCSVVYGAQTVLLLPVAHRLGLGDSGLGLLMAAIGAGGVLGSVFSARLAGARNAMSLLSAALLVAALTLPLAGVAHSLAVMMVLVAVSGMSSLVVEVLAETALQRAMPEEVFAAAYGIAFPAAVAGIVAGSVAASALYALVGLTPALTMIGVVVAALAATGVRSRAATVPSLVPVPA